MSLYRRLMILGLLFVLAACGAAGEETPIEESPVAAGGRIGPVVIPISINEVYVLPDHEGRWELVGQKLRPLGSYSTSLEFVVNPKDYPDQPFQEALANITAEPLEFHEEGDIVYAEGRNAIGAMILYRDYPEFVLEFRLFDSISDTFEEQVIQDWRMIALEGRWEILN